MNSQYVDWILELIGAIFGGIIAVIIVVMIYHRVVDWSDERKVKRADQLRRKLDEIAQLFDERTGSMKAKEKKLLWRPVSTKLGPAVIYLRNEEYPQAIQSLGAVVQTANELVAKLDDPASGSDGNATT